MGSTSLIFTDGQTKRILPEFNFVYNLKLKKKKSETEYNT